MQLPVCCCRYVFTFAPTNTYTRGDQKGKVHSGNMYICDQTTGFRASGPNNCSNTFVFDEYTCELSYKLSDEPGGCLAKVHAEGRRAAR